MKKLTRFDYMLAVAVLLGAVFVVGFLFLVRSFEEPDFGVTFSTVYAQELGLDYQEVFVALLDEVGVRKFRIPVYWDRIESVRGQYDWTELDWVLNEASGREGIEITLAIGCKVPRWPECWHPDWVDGLSDQDRDQAILEAIAAVVTHVGENPSVTRWQIENEPFLAFGEGCPAMSAEFVQQEIDLVRSLDDRPIQMTASGEQEPWLDMAVRADVLGVSMYRLVWSEALGYSFYPFGPEYYATKAAAAKLLADEVVISELQAEPWFPDLETEYSIEQMYHAFDEQALLDNIDFATRTGISEVYLWGAEWWYFMKENGESRHWKAVKGLSW